MMVSGALCEVVKLCSSSCSSRGSCFVQGPDGDKVVKMAIASPEKYVLKPQREGGGKRRSCILDT